MIKVKFVGDQRQTFTWTSMGKVKSYSVNPGKCLIIPESDLVSLLSFGKFVVVDRNSNSSSEQEHKHFERVKEVPVIQEVKINAVEEDSSFSEEDTTMLKNEVEETPVEPEENVVETESDAGVIEVTETTEETSETAEEITKEAVEVKEEPKVTTETPQIQKEKKVDYTSKKKAVLKKLCQEQGLDTSGNRDDLITRLVQNDKK